MKALKRIAKHRGITMQETLRAIIIPEWLQDEKIRSAEKRRRKR